MTAATTQRRWLLVLCFLLACLSGFQSTAQAIKASAITGWTLPRDYVGQAPPMQHHPGQKQQIRRGAVTRRDEGDEEIVVTGQQDKEDDEEQKEDEGNGSNNGGGGGDNGGEGGGQGNKDAEEGKQEAAQTGGAENGGQNNGGGGQNNGGGGGQNNGGGGQNNGGGGQNNGGGGQNNGGGGQNNGGGGGGVGQGNEDAEEGKEEAAQTGGAENGGQNNGGGGGGNGGEQGGGGPEESTPDDDPDDRQIPAPDSTPKPSSTPEPPEEAPSAAPETEPPTETDAQPTQSPTDGTPVTDETTELPPGPTSSPTAAPTESTPEPPTVSPTSSPTKEPTERPTDLPTKDPTDSPTDEPTESPTESPTKDPTASPTEEPTESPTESPTVSPTASPTEAPTEFPTEFPTMSPTASPAAPTSPPSSLAETSVLLEDPVSVTIKPVSGIMSAGNAAHFQTTAMGFLADLLAQLEQPIFNVDVSVTGGNVLLRRRRLEGDAMQVDMLVSGSFKPVSGLAETENDYSIGRVSRQFFNVQGDNFVTMLKDTDNDDDDAYFKSVSGVESVPDAADDATPVAGPPSSGSPPAPASDNTGMPLGGIVAVTLVAVLAVALGAAFLVKRARQRKRHAPNGSGGQEKAPSAKKSRKSGSAAEKAKAGPSKNASTQKPQTQQSNPALQSLPPQEQARDVPPIFAIGGPPSTIGGSEKGGGSLRRVDSDLQSDLWGAESLIGAESNMSYAFSLVEDGIQLAPSGASLTSAAYSETFNYGNDHSTTIPNEISNMLPDASADGRDANASLIGDDDELDVEKLWTNDSSSITREVTAPPGKLGVVLNTSAKGPVVQSIAAGSPLEGLVWQGDVIISIDGKKTEKMSASTMMEYMQENLFKERVLTIVSDPDA